MNDPAGVDMSDEGELNCFGRVPVKPTPENKRII